MWAGFFINCFKNGGICKRIEKLIRYVSYVRREGDVISSTEREVTFDELLDINDEEEFVTMEYGTQDTANSSLGIILHRTALARNYALINPYEDESKKDVKTYRIDFSTYIGISVFQEEFGGMLFSDDSDIYEGTYVRRYKKSALYDAMDKVHRFDSVYPDWDFVHYAFVTGDLQIDIISVTPPTVKEVHLKKGIIIE